MKLLARLSASAPVNWFLNNLFWAGCVVGRYEFIWLVGPCVAAYVLLLLRQEIIRPFQVVPPLLLGVLVDSLFTAAGLFVFEPRSLLLPAWMWVLWLAFVTTLPLSLRLFGGNPYLAALTGAIGFPASYFIGYQVGAIQFALPLPLTLAILSTTWAILLPVMYAWTNRKPGLVYETP